MNRKKTTVWNQNDDELTVLATYYFAYLNENDIVEAIYTFPSIISDPSYILIPEYDESLIGKKYNRETGEFEDIPVSDLDKLEKRVDELETGLTGHKADKDNPHMVTKAQIGLGNVDNTSDAAKPISNAVQTSFNAVNSKVSTLESAVLGGYKTSVRVRDNDRVYGERNLKFTFNTGIPGYFPKMVRLVKNDDSDDVLVADIYMIRDSSGKIVNRYVDRSFYGVSYLDRGESPKKYTEHAVDATGDVFKVGRSGNEGYDEGGSYFFEKLNLANGDEGYITNFQYDETSLSFTVGVIGLDGAYTIISMDAYVF